MICGCASTLFFVNSTNASKTARICISYISGYVIPTLTPLCPIIGLTSANSRALLRTICASLISSVAFLNSNLCIFSANSSGFGKNSCNGGSSSLIVTSYPSIAFKISIKSLFCNCPSFCRILFLSSILSAIIISTKRLILSLPLNILSVLHSPIP